MLYSCIFKIKCNLMKCSILTVEWIQILEEQQIQVCLIKASIPPTETTLRVSFNYIFKILIVIDFKLYSLTNLIILKFVDQRQIQMVIYI